MSKNKTPKRFNSAKEAIKYHEGFKGTAYPDGKTKQGKQLYSIGYGFNDSGAKPNIASRYLEARKSMSQEYADRLLDDYILELKGTLSQYLGYERYKGLTEGQLIAFLDTGYQNPAAMKRAATLYKKGDKEGAANALRVEGFEERNEDRRAAFLNKYSPRINNTSLINPSISIYDALRQAGVRFNTGNPSGYRTKEQHSGFSSGENSWHRHLREDGKTAWALDITPDFSKGATWETLQYELTQNGLPEYFAANGLAVLDETDPAIKKRTGATGDHYHIGKDRIAHKKGTYKDWVTKYSGQGNKYNGYTEGASGGYNPYVNYGDQAEQESPDSPRNNDNNKTFYEYIHTQNNGDNTQAPYPKQEENRNIFSDIRKLNAPTQNTEAKNDLFKPTEEDSPYVAEYKEAAQKSKNTYDAVKALSHNLKLVSALNDITEKQEQEAQLEQQSLLPMEWVTNQDSTIAAFGGNLFESGGPRGNGKYTDDFMRQYNLEWTPFSQLYSGDPYYSAIRGHELATSNGKEGRYATNAEGRYVPVSELNRLWDDYLLTQPQVINAEELEAVKAQQHRQNQEFNRQVDNFFTGNWLFPSQLVGAAARGVTGDDRGFWNNWLLGNTGVVTDNFAQEHPYWSTAANLAFDIIGPNVKGLTNAIGKGIENLNLRAYNSAHNRIRRYQVDKLAKQFNKDIESNTPVIIKNYLPKAKILETDRIKQEKTIEALRDIATESGVLFPSKHFSYLGELEYYINKAARMIQKYGSQRNFRRFMNKAGDLVTDAKLKQDYKIIENLINLNAQNTIRNGGHGILERYPLDPETVSYFENVVIPRNEQTLPYRWELNPAAGTFTDKWEELASAQKNFIKDIEEVVVTDDFVDKLFPEGKTAGFTGEGYPKKIMAKEGYREFAKKHEVEHQLDYEFPLNDTQLKIKESAYGEDFRAPSEDPNSHLYKYNLEAEERTTNLDARRALFNSLGIDESKIPPAEQNAIIEKASPMSIYEALKNSNGYGKAFAETLDKKYNITGKYRWVDGVENLPKAKEFESRMSKIKEAFKHVGMYTGAAVTAGMSASNQKALGGNLYANGEKLRISIKPAKKQPVGTIRSSTKKYPRYIVDPQILKEVNFNDKSDPIAFALNYYKSPGFQERFRKYTPKYVPKGMQSYTDPLRLNAIEYGGVPEIGTYIRPTKTIFIDQLLPTRFGVTYDDILSHELGHAISDAIYTNEKGLTRGAPFSEYSRASYADIYPVFRENRQFKDFLKTVPNPDHYKIRASTDSVPHDASPEESYADLISLRYDLYKNGIFDSTKAGQVFTKDLLNKYKEEVLKNRELQRLNSEHPNEKINQERLFDNFTDDQIIQMLNEVAYTPTIPNSDSANYADDGGILRKVYGSNANFVNRLKDKNRAFIPDWEDPTRIATHKLSVGQHGNFGEETMIYPEVQEINGVLVDFSSPIFPQDAGIDNAIKTGDYVDVGGFDTFYDALNFTKNYKKYFPRFDKK